MTTCDRSGKTHHESMPIYLWPLKPHFYIVKLGFTGVYIIFLISAQNVDCGYSLEPPRWGGSNEYPQSMFWAEIWQKYQNFYLKTFSFLAVKLSVCLNRRVFVMWQFRTQDWDLERWILVGVSLILKYACRKQNCLACNSCSRRLNCGKTMHQWINEIK